jgi:hypothetical protein
MQRNVKELVRLNAENLVWILLTDKQREIVISYAQRWSGGERNWQPIAVKQNGEILDGRHRLLAAFFLGLATIETICTERLHF